MESQETTSKQEAKVEPIKRKFVFGPNELDQEARHIARWHVFAPEGVSFDDLLRPEAWANIANRLSPMARITVTSEPGYFVGELVVISCGHLWANVKKLNYVEFGEKAVVDPNGAYVAEWVSNRYKFGVKRVSDGQWMIKDLPDMAAANAALAAQMNEFRRIG